MRAATTLPPRSKLASTRFVSWPNSLRHCNSFVPRGHFTLTSTRSQRAVFATANLRKAVFSRCELRGSNFCEANLEQADLRHAIFEGANLSRANLVDASARDEPVARPERAAVGDEARRLATQLVETRY